MFDLKVISPQRMVFEKEVDRVRVDGEETDFEILSFHADVAGILRKGLVVIDNRYQIPIKRGLISFHNNRCVILIEELKRRRKKQEN